LGQFDLQQVLNQHVIEKAELIVEADASKFSSNTSDNSLRDTNSCA
jgi:hypothetical protein